MRRNLKFAPFAFFLAALLAGLLIAGMAVIDGPETMRLKRIDARKLEDLQQIQRAMDIHYKTKGMLAASMQVLQDGSPMRLSLNDPETGIPYGYQLISQDQYRLCAMFHLSASSPEIHVPHPVRSEKPVNWKYEAGEHCFEIRAIAD